MKTIFIILFSLFLVIIIWLFIQGMNSRSGKPAGLINALLSKCSGKPNCVCSEYINDTQHFIQHLQLISKDPKETITLLKKIMTEMGGELQVEEAHYFAYIFTSSIFGFVDDFEIRFDQSEAVLHLRSASRVGTSDFGVNKKRIESFKLKYQHFLNMAAT